MNETYGTLFGVAFLAVAVFVLLRDGEFGIGPRGMTLATITRSDNPILFWLLFTVLVVGWAYCLWHAAHLIFHGLPW